MVVSKACRSYATRAAGMPGRSITGAVEVLRYHQQIELLAGRSSLTNSVIVGVAGNSALRSPTTS
jgi:hypothetical protein